MLVSVLAAREWGLLALAVEEIRDWLDIPLFLRAGSFLPDFDESIPCWTLCVGAGVVVLRSYHTSFQLRKRCSRVDPHRWNTGVIMQQFRVP